MIITLLTDFGEVYPGIMKGVILSINPQVNIVDITHGVPPQDVRAGAFILQSTVPYYPEECVHVGVVDPGVGSERRPIAVRSGDTLYVGPDNGLLYPAAGRDAEAYHITNEELVLAPSATFHGRDVFAPVAAHLSRGLPIEEVGPRVRDWTPLDFGEPQIKQDQIMGEIIYADSFGNLITNISQHDAGRVFDHGDHLDVGGEHAVYTSTYSDAGVGDLVALIGSHGYFEVGVTNGSAAKLLGLGPGDPITIKYSA